MSTVLLTGTFVLETCYKCGVGFGLPQHFYNMRREDHADFYCPNGHGQHYTAKSEAEELRGQIETKERQRMFWQQQSETRAREAVSLGHQLRSTKGVVTRIKRRVAHGVCPCCNRTFKDLARHMGTKHPDFSPEVG